MAVTRLSALVTAMLFVCGCPPKQSNLTTHSSPQQSTPSPESQNIISDTYLLQHPSLGVAVKELNEKKYQNVLRLCEEAKIRGASHKDILYVQSVLFKETQYLDKELEALKEWQKLDVADTRPLYKLFYLYLDIGWRYEAAKTSDSLLRLAPQDSRSHVTKALLEYRSNEPKQAIAPIETARRLDQQSLPLVHLHASILLKAMQYVEAEKVLSVARANHPKEKSLTIAYAQSLIGLKRSQEAEILFQTLQAEDPKNVEAAFHLATLALNRNDFETARKQFEKVTELDSQYGNSMFQLGRIYIQQGKKEEGLRLQKLYRESDAITNEFETALTRLISQPNNPDLHLTVGRSRLLAEEYPQAIVEFKRTLQLRPSDAEARKLLIEALEAMGRQTEALQLQKTASKSGTRK